MRSETARAGLLLAVAAIVAAPAAGMPSRDSFPLSTYPMFSHDRGTVIETLLGVDADGQRHVLDPRVIADTDRVVHAHERVRRAVARGPNARARLCREAARRLDDDSPFTRLVLVRERYDPRAYFVEAETAPVATRVLGRCAVESR